jgi:recombination protein RecT
MTATDQQPGTDVAPRDNSPRGLIEQYSSDFATVLPSHIKADTWVRVAQGALKKGKKEFVRENGQNVEKFQLEIAAANNPAAFLSALLDAARQGLEPGTEQYYLTPRKVKGKLEILGIRGYQGEIELMYRAGAVSSVIVEVVREKDSYRYRRGLDEVPVHEFPSFAGESKRGPISGVYAYARMKDGAVSRVIELGREYIDKVKAVSQGSDSEYSPWVNWEESMWLKTGAHQLRKWVPTSAEYIREQYRAQAEANKPVTVAPLRAERDHGANPSYNGDQIFDAEIVDGVDTSTGEVIDPDAAGDPDEPPQSFFDELNREAQP